MSIPWMALSHFFGTSSIFIWLCAQVPQIVENYRLQSVSGLSLGFLVIWMLGDSSGLVGCILTGQLGFQTVLSCYYVAMDVVLGLQYYLYTRPVELEGVIIPGYSEDLDNSNRRDSVGSKPLGFDRKRLASFVSIGSIVGSFGRANGAPIGTVSGAVNSGPTRANTLRWNTGYLFAYFSSIMYVSSRIPQIHLNYQRKSTAGVSVMLFSATLCGNLFYASSILCAAMSRRPEAVPFLMNELPYIVGSAGTVLFDVIILIQMAMYRPQQPKRRDRGSSLDRLRAKVGGSSSTTPLLLSHQSIYSEETT